MRLSRPIAVGTRIALKSKIRPYKRIHWYSFDGGLVLLDKRTGRLFAYNDSAAVVWRALVEGVDAVQALADRYGIPPDTASQGATAVIEHWDSFGLLSSIRKNPKTVAACGETAAAVVLDRSNEDLRADYRIGGRLFRIAVSDPDVAERVVALFRNFEVEATGEDAPERLEVLHKAQEDAFVLKHDGAEILRVHSVAEITGALFQSVLSRIHSNERWLAVIHGGSVSSGGRAVLLPGASGSGKSTLGAFLVARGFDYLCDDMLAVTEDGRVANWPIPISIKEGSWKALAPYLPQLDETPAEFAWGRKMKLLSTSPAAWEAKSAPATVIVFPKFARSAGTGQLVRLKPLEALERLISDRIWLGYPLHSRSVQRFLRWLETIPAYALTYSNFDNVERLVGEALQP